VRASAALAESFGAPGAAEQARTTTFRTSVMEANYGNTAYAALPPSQQVPVLKSTTWSLGGF